MPELERQERLKSYLENLSVGIEQGHDVAGIQIRIASEKDLEKFVQVKSGEARTLLNLLGYSAFNVEDHPPKRTVIGRLVYAPDYVLNNEAGKALAVLDVKAPSESLEGWEEQILSYCVAVNAPLGMLFNGRAVQVFVNTKHKAMKRYANRFPDKPVASANSSDPSRMVDLLNRFAWETLAPDVIAVARKLATEKITLINKKQREQKIAASLKIVFATPPPEVLPNLFTALASADAFWSEISPKPTANELLRLWKELSAGPKVTIPPLPRTGVNPAVRAKIIEVCGKCGWKAIEDRRIRGLNYRVDGVNGKGYRKVGSGPGVPENLMVQGMDTPNAERVINELNALLQ